MRVDQPTTPEIIQPDQVIHPEEPVEVPDEPFPSEIKDPK